MEHFFTVYVRTKMVFQHRLKDLKSYDTVKIYVYEFDKLGVKGDTIFRLRQNKEIWYDENGNFRALNDGPIDPSLLEKTRKWEKVKAKLSPLHIYMRSMLLHVSIDTPLDELPVYFKAFMTHRLKNLDLFFSVDGFSGRVHTPVVNLKGIYRGKLKLKGSNLCSLDVKQMQPTILAKILESNVGKNPFSEAVNHGRDIYMVILEQNTELHTRDDAKKFLYQLIFGRPMDDIGRIFKGDTRWVSWINQYKSKIEPKNPHGRETHTNLAWLLQSSEVNIMSSIWKLLMDNDIPFLTIHDDILIRKKDKPFVYPIFENQLSKHFKTFEITVT